MKKSIKGKHGFFALKLDVSKAYDRVEWGFLRAIMSAFGFHVESIDLVMHCTSTSSYSLLISGKPSEAFYPTRGRGLRQGTLYHLNYLFLSCAEGFSSLIKQAIEKGDLHGIKVSRGAPQISHLLFVDNSIVFKRANERESCITLKKYEHASSQNENLEKIGDLC